jgi:peptidyl-prolyl cis-trans isomerase A (cyclophilin A)
MRKLLTAVPVVAISLLIVGYIAMDSRSRLTPDMVKKAVQTRLDVDEVNAKGVKLAAAAEESKPEGSVPDVFKVKFECSNGTFVAEFHKEWAPHGAQRVYDLVNLGFYNDARFFRVLDNFMAQFGMAADPVVNSVWSDDNLEPDRVTQSNTRGMITFAQSGQTPKPGYTNAYRSTQLFINFVDNAGLDSRGFAPVGKVIEGMEVVDTIFKGYGQTPSQGSISAEGNDYLNREFPRLDYIKKATLVKPEDDTEAKEDK